MMVVELIFSLGYFFVSSAEGNSSIILSVELKLPVKVLIVPIRSLEALITD